MSTDIWERDQFMKKAIVVKCRPIGIKFVVFHFLQGAHCTIPSTNLHCCNSQVIGYRLKVLILKVMELDNQLCLLVRTPLSAQQYGEYPLLPAVRALTLCLPLGG